MKQLFIYIKPTTTLECLVEAVGEIIGYPIIDYETDRFDEYPGYEIELDLLDIFILGVPHDLDNLRDMFPEEFGFGEQAETHQIYVAFKKLPVEINSILKIDYTSDKDFCEKLTNQLQLKGFELSTDHPIMYSSIGNYD